MWGSCGDHVGIMVRSWHVATVSAQRAESLTVRHSAQKLGFGGKGFFVHKVQLSRKGGNALETLHFCCKKLSQIMELHFGGAIGPEE